MRYLFLSAIILLSFSSFAQTAEKGKPVAISPDLFGIFFEDISYAADGGLYAELVQNRSFEYTPADRKEWHSMTSWRYETEGFGYGKVSVETAQPMNASNPHYVVLTIEEPGQKGIGLINEGFDGIAVRAGEKYDFSLFARVLSTGSVPLYIALTGAKGQVYASATIEAGSHDWKKYQAVLTADHTDSAARLVCLARGKGQLAMDVVSLFPENTFKHRVNGMRADLAEMIAGLHPKFMRFPGGCLVHGDGLGNMYRWKHTIGPIEQRVEQRNIWGYHQSVGLGYFEYFQFCEDIGAKPLPVLSAGVSCQNSGGTWRIGGTGQKGLPMEDMQDYIQEVLDLVEYANGPVSSVWGAKRAEAGHPEPFHLQYVGIGNEDKQTDAFRERFNLVYAAMQQKHPEITVVGTAGPFPDGEDYELGWKLARQLGVPVMDEHYYQQPSWFLKNNKRYDGYDRSKSQVYVGEYASWGNTLHNALAEAAYMTGLERNGDVVRMCSYAPLLANEKHTSWNPDLIYFNNVSVLPTVNYYVQQLFMTNAGDLYYPGRISFPGAAAGSDSLLASSCLRNPGSGDIIVKLVNAGSHGASAAIDLSGLGIVKTAALTVLTGDSAAINTHATPLKVSPSASIISVSRRFKQVMPPYSLQIIRIKRNH